MGITRVTTWSLLICGLFVITVSGLCTFPSDLDGVFDSSHERDQLTFNSSYVSPFWVDTQSDLFEDLVFMCNFIDGDRYLVRSVDPITIYTVPYYVHTCWEFKKLSADKFIQYQGTTKLTSAASLNVKVYPIAYSITASLICDVTDFTGDTISILVKNGTASNEKISCPVSLWGKYVYTLTDTSGVASCNYNSWLDICSSTNTLTVNTTLCSSTTLYSSGGTLYCMYSLVDSSSSGTYYVYLYNDDATVDSSTTYRFTCLVMQYTSSVTYMTQYPGECLDSTAQTATLMATSPGGLYTMYANVTCPPTSDSMDPTVVIVVVVILVLIIGLIIGVCYYKKVYLPKKNGRSSKVTPDTLPNTAMTADKNYQMMFTPAPLRSVLPGKRGGAAGDPPAQGVDSRGRSAVSLRPTVATYCTPSPFITEGKDLDVDSLLDLDYPPSKQGLGDPDGAEGGVLLEIEGSIPVYSEAGDTPEPTRITPLNSGKR